MTRVCVFTIDLGEAAGRECAILGEVGALTGRRSFDDVCFVGLRNLAAALPAPAYQPFIAPREYGRARLGHALLRVAGRAMMPAALARAGLSICGSSLVEAITACDPDVVLLNVPWASHFKRLLAAEFPGRVVARGESARHGALASGALDPDVKVSIVLPTFNGVKYLRQSIQSCLARHTAISSSSSLTMVRKKTSAVLSPGSLTPGSPSCVTKRIRDSRCR